MKWEGPMLSLITFVLWVMCIAICWQSVIKLREGAITRTIGTTNENVSWPSLTMCNYVLVTTECEILTIHIIGYGIHLLPM